jgi:hypothetical protein
MLQGNFMEGHQSHVRLSGMSLCVWKIVRSFIYHLDTAPSLDMVQEDWSEFTFQLIQQVHQVPDMFLLNTLVEECDSWMENAVFKNRQCAKRWVCETMEDLSSHISVLAMTLLAVYFPQSIQDQDLVQHPFFLSFIDNVQVQGDHYCSICLLV